jgi:hypothetical protein
MMVNAARQSSSFDTIIPRDLVDVDVMPAEF